MIVDLYKVLIYGSKEELDRFFELAQRAAFIEFIGLSHKKSLELTEEIKTILTAINIAKKHEVHPDQLLPSYADLISFAKKLIELSLQQEQLLEEQRVLTIEIARVAPFGNFNKKDLEFIEKEAKRIIQFFCMKHGAKLTLPLPPELIYIHTEYDLDYFIAINKTSDPSHKFLPLGLRQSPGIEIDREGGSIEAIHPPSLSTQSRELSRESERKEFTGKTTRMQYPKMIEILIDRPLGELKEKLREVKDKLSFVEREIRNYSNGLPLLQTELLRLLNEHQLKLTKHDAVSLLDGSVFAIEAWIPVTRRKALHGILSKLDVCVEEIAIESQDKIPTCMENTGAARLGEDLVHIYDTPAHTDKDPSLWILVFFAIFFAMIVSDAGYGLLYLSAALFCKWKFKNLKAAGRRFIKLAIIISSCCILWGVASASFFGIEIGPNNPYRRVSIMHMLATKKADYHIQQKDDVYQQNVKEFPATLSATDGHDFLVKGAVVRNGKMKYVIQETFYDNIFLELSLMIGVIHISLAFFRYLLRNWAGFGWILFLIGGYLYFPKMLNATSILNFTGIISKETAYAWGFQLIWYGIGLAFVGAFLQKRWGAFHEMMNVIQIFGDVLSYIRIYALALAGMMVASTFNGMGESAGLIGGALIIIAGHLVNIALSIMGGMIHGLRLNFLEWYHYCFEGGGRLFNPLRLRK